jgi:hypothetical protein
MPARHAPLPELDVASPRLREILATTHDWGPEGFEAFLGMDGVGPRTLRVRVAAPRITLRSDRGTQA